MQDMVIVNLVYYMRFFYKHGHNLQLSINEFEFLTDTKVTNSNDQFFLSDKYLPANQTGSIVYVGEVLGEFDKNEEAKVLTAIDLELKNIQNSTTGYITYPEMKLASLASVTVADARENLPTFDIGENPSQPQTIEFEISYNHKKIGFVLPQDILNKAIKLGKQNGFGKVSSAGFTTGVNFGNWKQTTNWIVSFVFEGKLILGKIISFANQEFWSDLDTYLPHLDMKRGVINLKLARSLLNLTQAKNIVDPFAGLGRILVAGLDLKDSFIASDIDDLTTEIQENYNKGVRSWTRNYNMLQTRVGKSVEYKSKAGKNTVAIVTEGYLGNNFKTEPSEQEMYKVWSHLEDLWVKHIDLAKTNNISEIVFCLPFYKTSKGITLPEKLIERIKSQDGVKVVKFANDKEFILYSRQNTITGHLIMKIVF